MSELTNSIPVIDLFAGPGGLGEGFSSVYKRNKRVFDIKLSIEKDENAHKTLELRSFYRQFEANSIPEEYYKVLKESNIKRRIEFKKDLFKKYPEQYEIARKEAWLAELGAQNFPSKLVDLRIKEALNKCKKWALIGGPPCQAYSLAGRSRVGGISEEDHRVYLYKEYLRIIAVHHPSVFVMENVRGLLSAEVNDEKVFDNILKDLKNPGSVFKNNSSPRYRIFSLVKPVESYDIYNNPSYNDNKDYLIKSEKYGVPQKRHRVILLGIRQGIDLIPDTLEESKHPVVLRDVIGDLPKIRSGISRSFQSTIVINGKKRRIYKKENDSNTNWEKYINSYREEIISWNGFAKNYSNKYVTTPYRGKGSEFIKCKTPSSKNPLYNWYRDSNLGGACNHESRSHLLQDLKRYMFSSMYSKTFNRFPRLHDYEEHSSALMPDHKSAKSGKFSDRFRVQLEKEPATTITSHISKDGHYFIHYDSNQCRSLTVREAARIQTFPDNFLFCGPRTSQYHQVGNAVSPYLAFQIAELVSKLFKK